MARLVAVFVGTGLLFYLATATGSIVEQVAWSAWWHTALGVAVTAVGAVLLLAGAGTRRQGIIRAGAQVVMVGFPLYFLMWEPAWNGHVFAHDQYPWMLDYVGLASMAAVLLLRGRWLVAYHVFFCVWTQYVPAPYRPALGAEDLAWYAFNSVVFSGVFVLGTYSVYRSGARADAEAELAETAAAETAGTQALAMERERVDALIHDDVLSTLLAVARTGNSDRVATLASGALERLEGAHDAEDTAPLPTVTFVGLLRSAVASADPGSHVRVTGPTAGVTASPAVARELAAATMEAVRNAALHSGDPDGAFVDLELTDDAPVQGLRITVTDRGRGFDPREIPQIRLGVRGSILGRMSSMPGGRAVVDSRPGAGTRVEIGWTP